MPAPAPSPAVELRGLTKRFGEMLAVRDVDMTLRRGEVHALLGENGAGKTTLMCLLAGLYRPDGGQIVIDGREVVLRSPRDAMAASIGMVHQHFMLVPTLTVAENVLLGAARVPTLLRPRRIARQVQADAERLGLAVHADAPVGSLSVGEQQRVEILRVLSRGARVLILDEPTAVLSPAEIAALLASLRRLTAEGCAVVLISHKLDEVRHAAQRLTVMRRGQVVARFDDPAALTPEELAAAMVGREVSLQIDRPTAAIGEVLLRVSGLHASSDRQLPALRGVDLEVRRGELVGLAGVAGNGQRELLEVIAGLRPASAGRVHLGAEDLTGASPRRRIDAGLRYVPEDRQTTGTSPSLSVAENLLLRRYRHAPCRRGPWLDLRADEAHCRERVAELQIAVSSLEQSARLLSGGNLQKVVLARELCPEAQLILAMQPTRGLDAWATAEVRRLLLGARARGAALLVCSEDLEELLALADRVAVMAAGRIVHLVDRDRADRLTIGQHMAAG
jgi:general nucleoside transport system ATP-binding protein